jgi:chromosome segregation ATPase
MSEQLSKEKVEEILKTVNQSLGVLYKTINKCRSEQFLKVKDLEQEVDILRSEISEVRRVISFLVPTIERFSEQIGLHLKVLAQINESFAAATEKREQVLTNLEQISSNWEHLTHSLDKLIKILDKLVKIS